jgi:hypothetical protein
MENNQQQSVQPTNPAEKRPNETSGIHVEAFVKIFDPKSQETFVEKRA